LKAGLWFRRTRLVILAPDPRYPRRVQADNPLSDLSEFTQPSLPPRAGQRRSLAWPALSSTMGIP